MIRPCAIHCLIVLLAVPLTTPAAEWRYSDRAPGASAAAAESESGDSSGMATAQRDETEAAPSTAAPTAAGPPPDAPSNNMTMSAVRDSRGEPEKVLGPVGEPPITRWQYADYVVYFENDRVITAVAGRL